MREEGGGERDNDGGIFKSLCTVFQQNRNVREHSRVFFSGQRYAHDCVYDLITLLILFSFRSRSNTLITLRHLQYNFHS